MTEDEAKAKWCPFVRFVPAVAAEHPAFPNRPFVADGLGDQTRCIGSACMAWREHYQPRPFLVTYAGKPEEPWAWDPTGHAEYETASVRPNDERFGHCGLAGDTP